MATIEFIYKSAKTPIQCNIEDKISNAIEKFLTKAQQNKDEIIFIYNGNKLDEELTFTEAANNLDKISNLMKVVAYDKISDEEKISPLKKSKYIICPECQENSRISIKNFQISLYDCINAHITKNIQINEFEKTQFINQSKIICDICKEANKSESTDNKFFICFACKMNVCLLCKDKHDKSHILYDYDDKDFYCKIHSDAFSCYCCDCLKDLCTLCENQHLGHNLIYYGTIIPNKEECKKDLENLNVRLKDLKKNIKDIISKLNQLNESLDSYYEIYNNMVTNFDIRKRNYSSLQNINDTRLYNNTFMQKITEIINDNNIKTKFNDLLDLFNKMSFNEEKIGEENKINENEETEEGNQNEKKEATPESNEDTLEDKNYYDNIQRYNPSDDKYENFQIDKLGEIKSFEVKYDIKKIKILHDRRLLTCQSYKNEKGDLFYKIIVYDLTNGIICDINYDIKIDKDSWYSKRIENLFQMNDDKLIIFLGGQAKIFKVKRKSIEEINCINVEFSNLYTLLNEKFLTTSWDWESDKNIFKILSYENEQLNEIKKFSKKIESIENICAINENEIAIYYSKDGKLFGQNAFLLFYDITNYKDIKTLKLGNYEYGNEMFFLNDKLIIDLNEKIQIIDTKSRAFKKELKINISNDIIVLNNNEFLENGGRLRQYKLENSNVKLIGEKRLPNNFVDKYPDNQLITEDDNKIYIYGQTDEKEKVEIHYGIKCDGCRVSPIRGNRYKCKECEDFDFCQDCYRKNKINHGHEFKLINIDENK